MISPLARRPFASIILYIICIPFSCASSLSVLAVLYCFLCFDHYLITILVLPSHAHNLPLISMPLILHSYYALSFFHYLDLLARPRVLSYSSMATYCNPLIAQLHTKKLHYNSHSIIQSQTGILVL